MSGLFSIMDLIIGHQTMKLSNLLIRSISKSLPNNCIIGSVRCVCYANTRLQNIALLGGSPNAGTRSIHHQIIKNYSLVNPRLFKHAFYEIELTTVRSYSTETPNKENNQPTDAKPTLFQKMKQMTKDYWHILIPVHVATSVIWISVFYIAVKNGVDIAAILKYFNLSETYLEKIRNSKAGHWAVAYALFKVCTPVRYTVTIGGTTMAIRYLNKWGIMKFKTPEKMKDMLSSKTMAQHKARFGKTDVKTKTATDPPKT